MPSKDMDVPVRRVHVSSVQYVACDMYGLLHQMVHYFMVQTILVYMFGFLGYYCAAQYVIIRLTFKSGYILGDKNTVRVGNY